MESSEGAPRDAVAASGAASRATAEAGAASRLSAGRSAPEGTSGPEAATGAEVTDGIRISCLMNARYHATREAFLDNVHRWFMFLVIALGAGALIDVVAREIPWARELFAALAAIIAALDLTFDLSNRARTHSMMKRRYFELLADYAEGTRSALETRACIDRYGADEEPAYHVVLKESWNAAQEAIFGDAAHKYKIPWWHRLTRNLLRHGDAQFDVVNGQKMLAS